MSLHQLRLMVVERERRAKMVCALTPGTLECIAIWQKGPCRCDYRYGAQHREIILDYLGGPLESHKSLKGQTLSDYGQRQM